MERIRKTLLERWHSGQEHALLLQRTGCLLAPEGLTH